MKIKHTPGPWVVNEFKKDGDFESRFMVTTEKKGISSICIADICANSENECGNASLIAAAPEMFRALEAASKLVEIARKYFPKSIKNSDTFTLENIGANEINAALRKARGES